VTRMRIIYNTPFLRKKFFIPGLLSVHLYHCITARGGFSTKRDSQD
jgi:hypothetical protein